MNRAAYPAQRGEVPIGTRPAEPEPAPLAREWHLFEDTNYVVLLVHRGVVIDRMSTWTKGGCTSANQDAIRWAVSMNIEPASASTPLAVVVIRKDWTYEKLYVGHRANPHWYNGSELPREVAFYDEWPRNKTITHTTIVWTTHPGEFEVGTPAPAFITDDHRFQE